MVGTKRFKFDVFSNDVTLANEMESTGVAGRVHVSEHTSALIRDDYILEDGPDYNGINFFRLDTVRFYRTFAKKFPTSNDIF